ncbi:MAG: hypothetical protein KDA88_23300 [Planctomycetaceae bacterium]|nr:hypothetical protein [Planctomycetaceae bacterium]MCB9951126.1 glycosyltransferase family 2 protein [Planctomycetaceae bacterium]
MPSWTHSLRENFYRFAASGWISPQWFQKPVPPDSAREGKTGRLRIEIVSHCWQYAHLQAYQLSSLVLHPPKDCDVQMTVFYSPEDIRTKRLLEFFSNQCVENVTWNWWALEKGRLFRRAIGRNLAALNTKADWIWFNDCDQLFHAGCLDAVNEQLQGRSDALCFPTKVSCTRLLEDDDAVLTATSSPAVVDIDPTQFESLTHSRAIGALQILHGDVARQFGYCNAIRFYQEPVERWHKCYEDRALRWLLGTQGTPIDVPGIYRIEHVSKGRYAEKDGQPNLLRRVAAKIAPRDIHRIGKQNRDAA